MKRHKSEKKYMRYNLLLLPLMTILIVGCGGGSDGENGGTVKDKTHEFVEDARTWGISISEEASKPNTGLNDRITVAGNIFDVAGPLLSNAMEIAFKAAGKAYVSGTDVQLSDYDSVDLLNPITSTGQATVIGNRVTVDGQVNDIKTDLVVDFPASLIAESFTVTVVSGSVVNLAAEMVIGAGTATLNYGNSIDITPWVDGTNVTDPFPGFDSASLIATVTIRELITDPVSFTGTLEHTIIGAQVGGVVVRDINNNVVQYNPGMLNLEGQFGTASNYFSARLAAVMPNADTFFPVVTEFPSQDEDINNFRQIQNLTLEFILQLEGLPEASFSIVGNRTEFEGGDLTIAVTYGNRSIVAVGNKSNDTQGNVSITVTSDQGDKLILSYDITAASGNITLNGEQQATISPDPANSNIIIIRYNDGSFESL